jgi:electron transport complex protein RnfG
MREIIKPAAALLIITLAASALLGFVHGITKEPIERQQALDEANAIKEIFPEAAEVEDIPISAPDGSSVIRAAEVMSETGLAGYAIYASPSGYGGAVSILVGVNPEGAVAGVRILSHQETPGLGANAANPSFLDNFKNASSELTVTKSTPGENEIQAITSATITSSAVVKGVNDARQLWTELEVGSQ